MEDREPYITGGNVRDKYLTEAMGECWHEAGNKRRINGGKAQRDCICGESSHWETITNEAPKYRFLNNDFSTWEGFGKLWEWTTKQEWWIEFIKQSTYLDNSPEEIEADIFHMKLGIIDFIVPSKFVQAVFLFLVDKESK